MPYRIIIEQSDDLVIEAGKEYRKVYEQIFETIELAKIILAVNARPRKSRAKKGTLA